MGSYYLERLAEAPPVAAHRILQPFVGLLQRHLHAERDARHARSSGPAGAAERAKEAPRSAGAPAARSSAGRYCTAACWCCTFPRPEGRGAPRTCQACRTARPRRASGRSSSCLRRRMPAPAIVSSVRQRQARWEQQTRRRVCAGHLPALSSLLAWLIWGSSNEPTGGTSKHGPSLHESPPEPSEHHFVGFLY